MQTIHDTRSPLMYIFLESMEFNSVVNSLQRCSNYVGANLEFIYFFSSNPPLIEFCKWHKTSASTWGYLPINRSVTMTLQNLPKGSKIILIMDEDKKSFIGDTATQFATWVWSHYLLCLSNEFSQMGFGAGRCEDSDVWEARSKLYKLLLLSIEKR